MDLQVLADGRHSVPTSSGHRHDSNQRYATRTLHPAADRRQPDPGAVTTVPLSFPALTGSGSPSRSPAPGSSTRRTTTPSRPSPCPSASPSWASPASRPGVPGDLPGTCQSNLLQIDGHPVTVSVVGSTAAALAGGELAVEACGADAGRHHPLRRPPRGRDAGRPPDSPLGTTQTAGTVVNCQAAADCVGWNIDQLTLDSAPGGGPEPTTTASDGVATGTPRRAPSARRTRRPRWPRRPPARRPRSRRPARPPAPDSRRDWGRRHRSSRDRPEHQRRLAGRRPSRRRWLGRRPLRQLRLTRARRRVRQRVAGRPGRPDRPRRHRGHRLGHHHWIGRPRFDDRR